MAPNPFLDLMLPTPLGTLIASLIVFGGIMALVVLVGLLLRLTPTDSRPGLGTRLLLGIRTADRAMVRAGSRLTGTAMRQPWQRVPRLLLSFALLTAGGIALPFPAAMASLTLGLLAILLVFRHWSRDETERAATPAGSAEPPRLTVQIDGDLTIEMALACGYLLVVVPLAFARLHAADLGFQLNDGAGPFAFVFYMVIELLKLGTVVDYYDLFADQIAFGPLAQAHHPSQVAKYVTLGFRAVFDLIILTALKRMFEIAGRVTRGLDLRELREALESEAEDDDLPALARLQALAATGHAEALALLQVVAQDELRRTDGRRRLFGSEVRMAAAQALADIGQLDTAIATWQQLKREATAQGSEPPAGLAEALARATKAQRGESGERRRQDLEAQLQVLRQEIGTLGMGTEAWGLRLREAARVLRSLAGLTGAHELLAEAAADLRQAEATWPRETAPKQWAQLRRSQGQVLSRLGLRSKDAAQLDLAILAYRDALKLLDREAEETIWAGTQYDLAQALRYRARLRQDNADLKAALAAVRRGLTARPDMASWRTLRDQLAAEVSPAA
jgi:tetratricopeptide (TPR) repeat protein